MERIFDLAQLMLNSQRPASRRYAPEPAADVQAPAIAPDDQEVRDVHRFRDWEDRAADDAGVRRWGEL